MPGQIWDWLNSDDPAIVQRSVAGWYEKLFGRPADSTPMPEVAEWKFPRGGWLQVYQLPERAGTGSCTLAVDDIDELSAHLQSLGVQAGERSSGARVRTVMITDRGRESSRLCSRNRSDDGALMMSN